MDKPSCLAKYLISHSVWQVKTESFSSYININEKWHNVPLGKKIWEKCYIQQSQLRLSGLQPAGAGMPLIREGKLPIWRRRWLPTPGPLPGKSHGQRSLLGYSPWDHEELDTTE